MSIYAHNVCVYHIHTCLYMYHVLFAFVVICVICVHMYCLCTYVLPAYTVCPLPVFSTTTTSTPSLIIPDPSHLSIHLPTHLSIYHPNSKPEELTSREVGRNNTFRIKEHHTNRTVVLACDSAQQLDSWIDFLAAENDYDATLQQVHEENAGECTMSVVPILGS